MKDGGRGGRSGGRGSGRVRAQPVLYGDRGGRGRAADGRRPATAYSGTFVGVGDGIHDAQGTASVLEADGSRVLRLEDFRSTNGPDLYVYLATDQSASDYVSLGTLKGNSGNQNYAIPDGTDLEKYDEVLIWCKAFGVLFGSARIA